MWIWSAGARWLKGGFRTVKATSYVPGGTSSITKSENASGFTSIPAR